MKSFISKLGPEALWVLIGQGGTAIAGLLGIKLLTTVLVPSEFGRLAIANTVIAFVSVSLFGPLGQGLTRIWPIAQERGDLGAFYSISNKYGLYSIAASIVVSIGLIAVAMSIKGKDWVTLIAISLATGVALGWLGLRLSVFMAARLRRLIALLNISHAILKPFVAASLVLLVAVSASWAMVGYLVATLVVVFFAERFYRRIVSYNGSSSFIPKSIESGIAKNILSFSWPFALWGIFGWIHLSCDRWALKAFHGADIVGAFVVVSQLAIFPLIFGSGFLTTLLTPIAFWRAGDLSDRQKIISAYKILGSMTGIYILGAVLLVSLFFVFHYPLVLFISNIQFIKFSFLLPWLSAAWGLFYLGQLLSTFGMLANRPKSYIGPKLVSAIVAVTSTFYLSAKIGAVGVVVGLAASGLVYALWCLIIAAKLLYHPLIKIDIQKERSNNG